MQNLNPFAGANKRQQMGNKLMQHQYPGGDWTKEENVKRGFQEHYDNVRRLVPKERLLEYRIEEGWETLCKFLGESVPDEPFPKGNSAEDFQSAIKLIWKVQAVTAVLKVAMLGGGAMALARVARTYGLWERLPLSRLGLGRN